MAIDISNADDLRKVYMLAYDDNAITPSDVKAAYKSINLRYARELLAALTHAELLVVTEGDEGDVWQTYPETQDTMPRAKAEARIDEWLSGTKPGAVSAKSSPRLKRKADSKNSYHPCTCGCGEDVPGKSFYRPGHDARHAGQVGKEIAANYKVKGFDRRTLLDALPSDRLKAKAEAIAEKRIAKAESKDSKPKTNKAAEVDPGDDGTQAVENGTVKVGTNEYVAVRYTATGKVEYFKGEDTKIASKTAAKTFQVA